MSDQEIWKNIQSCNRECFYCNYYHVTDNECHKCNKEAKYHCNKDESQAFQFCSQECFQDYHSVGDCLPLSINKKMNFYKISEFNLNEILKLFSIYTQRETYATFEQFVYQFKIKKLELEKE